MWRALNQYVGFEAVAEFTLSCGNMYGEKQMLIILRGHENRAEIGLKRSLRFGMGY